MVLGICLIVMVRLNPSQSGTFLTVGNIPAYIISAWTDRTVPAYFTAYRTDNANVQTDAYAHCTF